ncbi:MAG: hypothetical protein HY429_02810 [Candidatus Levybacteria bacterium]|nr:hypothetical protein [Candidatus Levybacteria bacterium]
MVLRERFFSLAAHTFVEATICCVRAAQHPPRIPMAKKIVEQIALASARAFISMPSGAREGLAADNVRKVMERDPRTAIDVFGAIGIAVGVKPRPPR